MNNDNICILCKKEFLFCLCKIEDYFKQKKTRDVEK